MSITLAINNAVSGLRVNQIGLATTAQNVANANTEGYSRKVLSVQTQVVDNQGIGVDVSSISRVVDTFLVREMRLQLSNLHNAQTVDAFFTQVQNLFGAPGNNSSLSADLSKFGSSVEALTNGPENASLRFDVVAAGERIARNLAKFAGDIQKLRFEADQQIKAAVDDINTQLKEIEILNGQITRAFSEGKDVPELEDKRDAAINKIAQFIDVNVSNRQDGSVGIFTRGGRTLFEGVRRVIEYTPTSTVTQTTSFGAVTIFALDATGQPTGNGEKIVTAGDSTSVTTDVISGKIKGLLQARDTDLYNLALQVEAFATKLKDEVNAIHNQGSGFGAPQTLTGTRDVATTDAFQGTGTVRVSVVNSSGVIVNSVDLDLTALGVTTVGAVASAIDTALGADASVAVINGQLVMTATASGNGIAINNQGTAESVTGRGFSHYFGMNDFFVGKGAANLAVRSDISSNPGFVTTAELSKTAAIGQQGISIGDNRVIQKLAGLMDTPLTFQPVGGLPLSSFTLGEFVGSMIGLNSVRASDALDTRKAREVLVDDLTRRIHSVSGVNVDEELANLIVFQNAYNTSAQVLKTASEMFDTLIGILK